MATRLPADPPHNLPAPPAPLLGREAELAAASRLLLGEGARLLTLTGPAGVGKTRLAVAIAAAALDAFPDGTWFVDLAPLVDPALVLPAIAQALGLHGVADARLQDALAAHLRDRRPLLVLDNLEHLLPAAPVVNALVAGAPGLAVLVTSREPLRLRREQVLVVPPLALPDPERLPAVDDLVGVPAVALFLQRARAVDAAFALTTANAPAVAELCARLDGLPLAIELVAARSRVLDPAAALSALDRRLALLRWEAADLPPRQRTLRAAFDWSHDLLAPAERALFRRLGVFAGGWAAEAAGAVGDAAALGLEALDALGALVDRSLVQVAAGGEGPARFGLLETVREYALGELVASGELAATRGRHLDHFLDLAEAAAPQLTGPDQAAWFARLEWEHENLRAALGWTIQTGDAERSLRLAVAMGPFWRLRGHVGEGRRWLGVVLGRHPDAPIGLRAWALAWAGALAALEDQDEAARLLEAAAVMGRTAGDESARAWALTTLGNLAILRGEARAAGLLAAGLDRWRAVGDAWGMARTLTALGWLHVHHDRRERAAVSFAEGRALAEGIGDQRTVATALIGLAHLAAIGDESTGAAALLAAALELARGLGDRRVAGSAVAVAAEYLARRGQPEQAARFQGAVDALAEAVGVVQGPEERRRAMAAMLARGDRLAIADALAAGRTMRPESVVAEALAAVEAARHSPAPSDPAADPHPGGPLSGRELEVLRLVAAGRSSRQIAEVLFIAESTVRFHVRTILGKLGAETRAQAVALATAQDLL